MVPTWVIVMACIALVAVIAIGWYIYRRCPQCHALSLVNLGFIDPPPKKDDEPRHVLMRCSRCGFEKRYPVSSGSKGDDGNGDGDGDGGGGD
jgi:RNase P subunit RPR2